MTNSYLPETHLPPTTELTYAQAASLPIQKATEHGNRTIGLTHKQYLTQHPIIRIANLPDLQRLPWPLPRSAPDMRPRGHSRQQNGEGSTGAAGGEGGMLWVGSEG